MDKHQKDCSVDEFSAYFYAEYPNSDKTIYDALFKQLRDVQVTPDVGQDIVDKHIQRKNALKLSELAFEVSQGTKTPEQLKEFTDSIKTDTAAKSILEETTIDLESLIEHVHSTPGLRWRLDCLNKSLGSLRKGDFGFIFARPETGKTTFLASEITGFLHQQREDTNKAQQNSPPVVWLNNEEDGWKVMLRVYCSYFGVSSDVIMANIKRFTEIFKQEVGGRFKLFDSATISRTDVERLVERLQPQLVVYDQIDKIKGFANDREDLRLGSIYQWARELAKGSHAAIGVCQADGHAEGVRYLTMEHVANAKTAKQAEADFILGIGKDGNPDLATARYLTISKNKLLGDPDSISDLRHGRFEVLIEPTIARYVDVIKFQ